MDTSIVLPLYKYLLPTKTNSLPNFCLGEEHVHSLWKGRKSAGQSYFLLVHKCHFMLSYMMYSHTLHKEQR